MQEFPVLDNIAKKFVGDRLAVLTINRDRSRAAVDRVLDKINTPLPVLRDKESEVFKAYRAYAVPTLYLIDRQGKIYRSWTGSADDLETQLTDNIGFVLKRHPTAALAEREG